jgi:hypothetical protein
MVARGLSQVKGLDYHETFHMWLEWLFYESCLNWQLD